MNGVARTRDRLMRGELTVTDHVEATLAGIAAEADLGAFVAVAGDEVRRAAADADAAIRALGAAAWLRRPLLGVTVAVKDLIRTADLPTARGGVRRDDGPRVDAPSVARLRAAGALVVGKTTTSEGGWSASTVGQAGPPTANPWAPEKSAGGSSGGSAAAVAAGLCDAALGTDGAGSIRIPAAFCGVVGFKPSYGRVPYVPTCADRLAHVGPLAAGVADAAELTAVIAGPHRDDPDSLAVSPSAAPPDRPLRIGWLEFPGTGRAVRDTSERIWPALRGHHVEPVETPFPDPYPALVDIIAAAEAAGTDEVDEPLCDPDRLAVVRHGRTVSGADVLRAEATRTALRVRMAAVFERYDVLAMATVPIEPFARTAIGPRWATGLSWLAWSPATYPFNLTGQPALSLPVGNTDAGLPVGVQLVGPPGADDLVLSVAAAVEARRGPLATRPLSAKVV